MTTMLVAAALALTPSPDAGARAPNAEATAAVLSAFKAYQAALLRKDGPACARLVDSATLAYYQRMRDLALTGGAAEIKKLPMLDKVMIVRMRHQVPVAEIKQMDGGRMLGYGVSQGWIGDKGAQAVFGDIDVNGDVASGAFMIDGKPTSTRMGLRNERGAWRINLLSVFPASNFLFKKLQKESGKPEDDFVLSLVGTLAGTPVPDTIWNPRK